MTQADDRSVVRERLRGMFQVDLKEHGSRWDRLWQTGDLPFDRGFPNPALVDTLAHKHELLGPAAKADPTATTIRKRALVPGCGRGYDVLLLAGYGYDAYGLEISSGAVRACEDFAEQNQPSYAKAAPGEGFGYYHYLLGDFFNDEWRESVSGAGSGFDLIYDYTFLCALPPQTRPAWAARMSELLNPDGILICVEFPTYKDPESGGPPFGLPSEVYLAHLSRPGDELPYQSGLPQKDAFSSIDSSGLRRVAHWQLERTHDIGKGTDWLSMWKHVERNE